MVSSQVTNVDLPSQTSFTGLQGSASDPDTFRFQVTALPMSLTPTMRVEVVGEAYSEDFSVLTNGQIDGVPAQRLGEYLRLVSNADDDAHALRQTIRVELEDKIRGTLLLGTSGAFVRELQVGRPAQENGTNAIRTADLLVHELDTASSEPQAIGELLNQQWAQAAIRFNLSDAGTAPAIDNVLQIEGVAEANGELFVDVSTELLSGEVVQATIRATVSQNDTASAIASVLAQQFSAVGIPTVVSTHGLLGGLNSHLLIVNPGRAAVLGSVQDSSPVTASGQLDDVLFVAAPLTLGVADGLTALELDVIGLNYKDSLDDTIDLFVFPDQPITRADGSTVFAAAAGDFIRLVFKGAHNTIYVPESAVPPAGVGLTIGHEMGHVLLDVDDTGHSSISTNMLTTSTISGASPLDTSVNGPKRLSKAQSADARSRSGPATVPPILKKR